MRGADNHLQSDVMDDDPTPPSDFEPLDEASAAWFARDEAWGWMEQGIKDWLYQQGHIPAELIWPPDDPAKRPKCKWWRPGFHVSGPDTVTARLGLEWRDRNVVQRFTFQLSYYEGRLYEVLDFTTWEEPPPNEPFGAFGERADGTVNPRDLSKRD